MKQGKIDLIHDKDRGEISCYARDNHTVITQGPFELKQGGYGIAVRNPVYLTDTTNKRISGDLPLLSYVFLIFSQTRFMLFQILDMNIEFQRRLLPGAAPIKLFISQIIR